MTVVAQETSSRLTLDPKLAERVDWERPACLERKHALVLHLDRAYGASVLRLRCEPCNQVAGVVRGL